MILRSVRVNTQIVTGQSRGGLLEFHLRDEDDQKRLEEAYASFMKIYQTTPRTLCHDDLLPFNLLIGERAVLIDWEYGGVLPYPTSFARLIAHGREEEGAFFCMTREDRVFAIQYYYDGLIGNSRIKKSRSRAIQRPAPVLVFG